MIWKELNIDDLPEDIYDEKYRFARTAPYQEEKYEYNKRVTFKDISKEFEHTEQQFKIRASISSEARKSVKFYYK